MFGFKEIYSPFVRRPDALPELIEHGVSSLRMLFPRAKFIFHWRENVSRISSSDFWRGEQHVVGHFQRVIGLYRTYAEQHADHAFCTTIEGIGSKGRFIDVLGDAQRWQARVEGYSPRASGLSELLQAAEKQPIVNRDRSDSVLADMLKPILCGPR